MIDDNPDNWIDYPMEMFSRFLDARSYSEKSKIAYRSIFNAFVRWLHEHRQDLTSANGRVLQEWLLALGVTHQTEIRYLSFISTVFDQMFDDGAIDENFAKPLIDKKKRLKRGRKASRLPVALDEKEFNALIAKINEPEIMPRRRVAVLILLGCGLRADELCQLKTKDVHLDSDRPYLSVIGKGNKEREIPIPDDVRDALISYEEKERESMAGSFFIGVNRRESANKKKWVALSPSGIYRAVQELMREAGIVKTRMSPHVLRHTYATRQLQAGVPLATLKMWMGHSSIATTMVYEHSVIARSGVRPRL